MQTINLEAARRKKAVLADFLDGLHHFGPDGLASYHAARAIVNAGLRVGVERRLAAVRKATKAFSVMASVAVNERGLPAVRLYSPVKQTEIYL